MWKYSRCLSSQRYNFLKANHNWGYCTSEYTCVVYQVKDTIFWKQITTRVSITTKPIWLFIKSKIQFFESKSQHARKIPYQYQSCLSSQRYNFLKANHNYIIPLRIEPLVVYQVKDTIFWKQITTTVGYNVWFFSCLSSQRYNFLKANHNSINEAVSSLTVVYQVKDTIFWK